MSYFSGVDYKECITHINHRDKQPYWQKGNPQVKEFLKRVVWM